MKLSPKIKGIIKKSYLVIGLIIFIWLIRAIDFGKLKDSFYAINPFYYILASTLYLPITFLKSYRWKKIMDGQKIFYSVKNAFLMYNSSALLGLITPGRIGDFSKIAYLTKDNHSFSRAILGNFLDKIFDVIFIIIFLFIVLIFMPFLPHFSIDLVMFKKWGWLGFILAAFVVFFYFKKKKALYVFFAEIWQDIKQFKLVNLFYILAITGAAWFFYFLMIYLVAASINITGAAGFFYIAFGSALGLLAGLLPISILGLGTRDAVFIFLFLPLGITRETIILFSLLIVLNYLAMFAICFYCWYKKPLLD